MNHKIFNVRTDVNAYDCTRGCTDTVRESALKVDSGRKIPCRTGKSNLRQRRDGPTLYQLSYIPTPQRFFFFFGSPRKLTKTPCESQLFSLLLFVWKFYFISIYETFWFRLVHTACKCCLCLFHLLGELFVVILPYNRLRCFWIVHTVLVYAANSLECMRSPCSRAQPRLKLFQ